ncbi:hypothetical protein X975_16977, partial [Stegodyphus mimosarum]
MNRRLLRIFLVWTDYPALCWRAEDPNSLYLVFQDLLER